MTRNDAKKIAGHFNRTFRPPFLPKGFAAAKVLEHGDGKFCLDIRIGDRDLCVFGDGSFDACGLDYPQIWRIEKDLTAAKKNERMARAAAARRLRLVKPSDGQD